MMHVMLALAAAAAGQIGVDAAATRTMKGSPETFDLAGFRLGMTEAEAEQVLRQRGMTVRRRTRVKTFEDQVRDLVNIRGGRLAPRGGSVLDNADVDDGRGGRLMIRMLAWPDGARIRSVTYRPPSGTSASAWQQLLIGKYGATSHDSGRIDGDGLHARWCGRTECLGEGGVFRLTADVDARGGDVVLSQPEGTSQKLASMVEREAAARAPGRPPSF